MNPKDKLTPTMVLGLKQMEKDSRIIGDSMGWPSDNTARALLKRGYLVETRYSGFQRFALTDKARDFLATLEAAE